MQDTSYRYQYAPGSFPMTGELPRPEAYLSEAGLYVLQMTSIRTLHDLINFLMVELPLARSWVDTPVLDELVAYVHYLGAKVPMVSSKWYKG